MRFAHPCLPRLMAALLLVLAQSTQGQQQSSIDVVFRFGSVLGPGEHELLYR